MVSLFVIGTPLFVLAAIRFAFADDELRGTFALVRQSTLDGGKRFPHLADLPSLIPVFRQQLVVLPGTLLAAGFDLTHLHLRFQKLPHVREFSC